MLATIFFLIFITIIAFCIYRITLKYTPRLIYNENGEMAKILTKMISTKKPYRPTPWLFNKHLQTIYGLRLRGRSSYKPQREDVFFQDGGQTTIEYFMKDNLPDDAPIVYIIHTLGGGSRESCTNFMAMHFMKNSYRVVICSCRGCNGSKITSRRFFNGYQTDDLNTIILHVNKIYPKSKNKFLIGFSLGSMVAAQYGIDCNEKDIDGIICVSHSIKCFEGLKLLETPLHMKLYYEPMMKSLKRLMQKSTFYTDEEKKAVMKARNFKGFDDIVTSKNMGLKNAEEYYKLIELTPKIPLIKVPTLFIFSENDPFSKAEWIPVNDIRKSKYVAFISTKEGGHTAFPQGWNNKVSYSEEVCLDFCNCIGKLKENCN
jgi:predicted alpha/beta-fold hydrolase